MFAAKGENYLKLKRLIVFIPQLIVIILELLPSGVVLKYTPAPEPNQFINLTTFYFDINQFSYQVFMPFLTGLITIAILTITIIWLATDKKKLLFVIRILCMVQLITSMSVLLWGIRYVSVVGTIMNGLIIAKLVIFRMESITGETTPRMKKDA